MRLREPAALREPCPHNCTAERDSGESGFVLAHPTRLAERRALSDQAELVEWLAILTEARFPAAWRAEYRLGRCRFRNRSYQLSERAQLKQSNPLRQYCQNRRSQ
jgi:hypothetical protein